MNILLSWLADFISINRSVPELVDLLTEMGLKVESVTSTGVAIDNIVVARILESRPHPNADRLSVCRVDDGSGTHRQIVCGAKNYKVGDLVPLALPGAVLPGNIKIKSSKFRGELSEGMMCSRAELGIGGDASGLWILPHDLPVGRPLRDVLPSETVIELEITPNRPDCLSHLGIARELAGFLDVPLRVNLPSPPAVLENAQQARIEPGAACSFYSLRRIRGIKVGPSPAWLRERIERVGLRSINNVVDVTNYVLMELGQPLHAFDAAKVAGQIVIRTAGKEESLDTLDGTTITLAPEDTVIADTKGPLALAGIIGGMHSGVSESTTDILLESAFFIPSSIRRTSRRTGISTDSSYRFERGVDPEMVLVASSRATAMILELAGGEAEPAATIAGNLTKAAKPVCLRHARVRSLLGLELPDDAIRECLRRAGLAELAPSAAGSSTWIAPSFRIDLTREVDLIEEVARFTGIAAIPSRVVSFPVPATRTDRDFDLASELRTKLVHAGFFEARTSTLVSETALGDDACNALRLKNPLGAEQSCLRSSLIPALLNCARANFHAGAKSVRLFEIGNRFSSTPPEQLPVLALFASGESVPVHWQSPAPAPIDFFAFAGVIQSLFPTPPSFVPSPARGFAARVEIRFKGTKIGWAGLLNPSRARELDAPADCLTAEIELPTLFDALAKPTKGISPIPKFPPVTRDLAIVLDASTPYAEIERTIQASAGSYLVGLVPFDVFTDPAGIKLPPNKKSIAVSLTFQSKERTLEHSEIDAALSALRKQLESQLGASFRE